MGPTRLPSCEGIHPSAGPLSQPLAFSSRALVSASPLEDPRPTRLDESFAKPQAPSKEPDKPFGGSTTSHRGRNWRGLINGNKAVRDRWLWRRNWTVVHPRKSRRRNAYLRSNGDQQRMSVSVVAGPRFEPACRQVSGCRSSSLF